MLGLRSDLSSRVVSRFSCAPSFNLGFWCQDVERRTFRNFRVHRKYQLPCTLTPDVRNTWNVIDGQLSIPSDRRMVADGHRVRSSLGTRPRTMTIHRSPIPDIAIPDESLFTFLFEGKVDREIPGTTPVFIDAPTGRSITRSEFKTACLSLGWGLRNVFAGKLGGMEITKGDTVMILSPNSFAWPIALLGSIAAGFKTTLANYSYTPAELGHQWKDSRAKVVFAHPAFVPSVLTMLEASGVSKEEARKRIIVMGVGDRDETANGFIHMDDLLGKGR
jgi:hypothetical protein